MTPTAASPAPSSAVPEQRAQVAAQYRAVAHMARALAEVHEQMASVMSTSVSTLLLPSMGARSHHIMETLGDILNGMDAVDSADLWVGPIFEKAREMFPLTKEPSHDL